MEEKRFDRKEIDYADTLFVRDIDSRVFQTIAIRSISEIEGVAFLEGTIIDNLLGREGNERIKGITVDQDQKNHSVSIKVEVNVAFGLSIPEKAEEIQSVIAKEVCRLTGLHVAKVHVVVKGIIEEKLENDEAESTEEIAQSCPTS